MNEGFSVASLLPPGAALAERFGSPAAGPLLAAEDISLGQVSDTRRREFALGRSCARQALQEFGLGLVPILRGRDGEPLWPLAICGSITHCDGYCAAVAVRKTDIASIGIDAELNRDFAGAELDRIAVETERMWIRDADPRTPWKVLLFSAKESVFKACHQVCDIGLGFEHARIEFYPPAHAFRAVVARTGCEKLELTGRFGFDRQRVYSCAFIAGAQGQPYGP